MNHKNASARDKAVAGAGTKPSGRSNPTTSGAARQAPARGSAVARVLARAEWRRVGGEWATRCPVHKAGRERRASLFLRQGEKGAILTCRAGCATSDVLRALGLAATDLFDDPVERPRGNGYHADPLADLARLRGWSVEALRALGARPRGREVVFPLLDAQGREVGLQRRRADGGKIRVAGEEKKSVTSLGGKKLLHFSNPLPGGEALVIEGEADACAALTALPGAAVVATGGAHVTSQALQELQRLLSRRACVLSPHADDAGRTWLDRVARALWSAQAQVRVAALESGDLDDALRAAPDKAAMLRDLVAKAKAWTPPGEASAAQGGAEKPAPFAVPVGDFLDADLGIAAWVIRDVVAGGGLTFLYGPPAAAKSFIVAEAARCVAAGQPLLGRFEVTQGPAVLADLEMAPPQLQERLRRLQAHHSLRGLPLYIRSAPVALNTPEGVAALEAFCAEVAPALVVFDPFVRAVAAVDENEARSVSDALDPVMGLARSFGFGVLVAHHQTKYSGQNHALDALRGSGDLAARADCVIRVMPCDDARDGEGAQAMFRLTWEKTRWGAPPVPVYFRVLEDAEGNLALVGVESPLEGVKRHLVEILQMAGEPLARGDLVREVAGLYSADQVDRALAGVCRSGEIRRAGRGCYTLANAGKSGRK